MDEHIQNSVRTYLLKCSGSDITFVFYGVTSENRPICGMTSDLSARLWDRTSGGNRPSCESFKYKRICPIKACNLHKSQL